MSESTHEQRSAASKKGSKTLSFAKGLKIPGDFSTNPEKPGKAFMLMFNPYSKKNTYKWISLATASETQLAQRRLYAQHILQKRPFGSSIKIGNMVCTRLFDERLPQGRIVITYKNK